MMIVQVINNGGVAQDQFDLLIPGGGVGQLNACGLPGAGQWGVQSSDLGAHTVASWPAATAAASCVQQKCQQLFGNKPDLLAGCDWFLGWFGAADNPKLTAKQIACPAMITQRSGLADSG